MSTQDDLMKKVLAGARVGPADPNVKEAARRKALAALGHPELPEAAPRPRTAQAWMLVSTVTVAVALLVVAVNALLVPHALPVGAGGPQLMAEMEKLFPHQLEAVIRVGDAVDLELADQPRETAADQRIVITLLDKDRRIEVFTYSGHEVCLKGEGAHLCFTPLLTGSGAVLVVTDGNVMKSPDGDVFSGFKWSAKTLPEVPS